MRLQESVGWLWNLTGMGRVRPGHDDHAVKIWRQTASRLHFNLDFRLQLSEPRRLHDFPTIAWQKGLAELSKRQARMGRVVSALCKHHIRTDVILVARHSERAGKHQLGWFHEIFHYCPGRSGLSLGLIYQSAQNRKATISKRCEPVWVRNQDPSIDTSGKHSGFGALQLGSAAEPRE